MMNNVGNRFSQHSFAQIPDVKIGRSKFDRSFSVKDTINFDELAPIFVDEVIPGDTHNVRVNAFARMTTLIRPVMDNMYVDFFFFFVPNRLVWTHWEKFNGAQDNPGDSISYVCPILTLGAAFTVGSIFDHFGLPTGIANVPVVNTLPLRCYAKIYNDWFRDENLQNSITLDTGDGPDAQADYAIQKRGKRHDYFTSSLPWPQKGATAVSIPLGTSANIKGLGMGNPPGASSSLTYRESGGYNTTTTANAWNTSTDALRVHEDPNHSGWPLIWADLTNATAATINQLRLAFMTQSLLELDARGGTRYVEILRSHFGVVSPDFRLQRAEYLGGGEIKINSHPVAQTAISVGSNYTGDLSAFATTMATGAENIGFSKSFVEHGYVIGLACPRADLTYQQGLNRMWSKSTRYDFFWPKLQQLGEQAVLLQEIYCAGNGGSGDTTVWGYQERYSEYKYRPSEIRGQFRSTYSTPLDVWHLAEKFASAPSLSSTFIVQNTPTSRIKTVTSAPDLLLDLFFKVTSARPMMTYSVPANLGRF